MVLVSPNFHYGLSDYYGRPTVHKDTTYRDVPKEKITPVDTHYEVYNRKAELVRRERQAHNVNFIIA